MKLGSILQDRLEMFLKTHDRCFVCDSLWCNLSSFGNVRKALVFWIVIIVEFCNGSDVS
jgi:hypothetical protein